MTTQCDIKLSHLITTLPLTKFINKLTNCHFYRSYDNISRDNTNKHQ